MAEGCCPKCGSRLFPDDEKYIKHSGVCGYCVSWDKTPDRRYQTAYNEGVNKEVQEAASHAKKRLQKNRTTKKPWWVE